jgi:LysM repeat protein
MGSVRRSNWKRFLPYLLLNILVSTGAILIVLFFWSRRPTPPTLEPTATKDIAQEIESMRPTATMTLPPSPTPNVYTVKSGDTLLDISQAYDIPIDVLMAANGIINADDLQIDQTIIIPSEEWVEAYKEKRVGSQTESTPTPSETVEPPDVVITGVEGAGELEAEAIRFVNSGGVANMSGWRLDDGEGRIFIFPAFTLHQGAFNLNICSGKNSPIDLFWGLEEPILSPGKTLALINELGETQSTFVIPETQ